MRDRDGGRWLLRAACVAVCAALPPMSRAYACILLLVLPLACACLQALGERTTPTVMALCLALGAWQAFPLDVLPGMIAWCAACGAMMWIAPRDVYRQGAAWLAVCAGCMLLMLALLQRRYQGPLAEGLARTAVSWINERDDAPLLLIRAYQYGLAGLTERMAKVPALQFGDTIVMTAETRQELLYSLRTTLATSLTGSAANILGLWLALTPLLCCAAPDLIRQKVSGLGELPEVTAWHLPRGAGLAVGLLGLGVLVRMLCGATVIGYAGSLCGGVFSAVYGVQGASSMLAQRGQDSPWRLVWMAAVLLLCPEVFVLIGAFDQIADPRGLRGDPQE